jgi:biotin transport system substrate-specific component
METTLKNVIWHKHETFVSKALLILFGICLLAIASQLSIPFQPVPLTFQSATVILIGMAYGMRRSGMVIMGYYLAAICGAPVLADMNAGIQHFWGPTGGYLIGFLPAAMLSGYLAERGFARNLISSLGVACLGTAIIFFLGVSYLSTFLGFNNAIAFGLKPFMMTEFVKLLAVSLLIPRLWRK